MKVLFGMTWLMGKVFTLLSKGWSGLSVFILAVAIVFFFLFPPCIYASTELVILPYHSICSTPCASILDYALLISIGASYSKFFFVIFFKLGFIKKEK